MQLKQLFTEEDAVSPVIGVILMVAITVILAAVIGTFVLNLGDQVGDSAPQAKFSFDYDGSSTATDDYGISTGDGLLSITHESGDKITASDLRIVGSTPADDQVWSDATGASTFVTAGKSIDIRVNNDDSLRLIFDDGSGDTATIQTWDGPNA
ncbi:type IV pilin N-terminal domain-containing protein [Haladaptatus sp. CMSO5]|uniref:type IV pilin N-terminal domain-containing protein n=1 Tax=Haladaptatus sp. CMSO5 TaxID=3120514 RepID=UPI002FCDEA1D